MRLQQHVSVSLLFECTEASFMVLFNKHSDNAKLNIDCFFFLNKKVRIILNYSRFDCNKKKGLLLYMQKKVIFVLIFLFKYMQCSSPFIFLSTNRSLGNPIYGIQV